MNGPVVVKLGGRALDEAHAHPGLWDALAALAHASSQGMVLVHGGGGAIDTHLSRLGLVSERRAGLRVTPEDQIDEVVGVLRGVVNTRLVGLLASRGVAAVGLGLSDGQGARCERHAPDGVDLGRVGVVRVKPNGFLRGLVSTGCVPVLCSIGLDDEGHPLNVNADDAAAGVASIVGASTLVLLTDVPGIRGPTGETIAQTDALQIESLIAEGVIEGGMIPKARAAVRCAESSGVPTVIGSWMEAQRLGDLAKGEPFGTRVRRPVRADTTV